MAEKRESEPMSARTGERSDFESADMGRARPFDVTHRMVWAITIPMTLAFLTTPLIGLTDTAVVGQVGNAAALGGLTVGALVFDFAFATCSFIRTGTTGLAAQAHGAGEVREVQAVFFRAAILAFGIGIALILFEPLITAAGLLAVSPGEGVAETVETYVFIRMISAPFALLNYAVLGTVLGLVPVWVLGFRSWSMASTSPCRYCSAWSSDGALPVSRSARSAAKRPARSSVSLSS